MGDMLLSVSNTHVFFQGKDPVSARDLHKPFFWAFPESGGDAKALRRRALEAMAEAQAVEQGDSARSTDALSGVVELGPVEEVESFWGQGRRPAFRVFTRHPGVVPSVSDVFFDRLGAFTAEHDVPYQQRLAVDLAAQGHWPFDTGGDKRTLQVSVFDIETTQYGNVGVKDTDSLPIDVIGWADFPFTFESKVDLDTEEFHLEVLDAPQDWRDREVVQEVARNEDEEVQLLLKFIDKVRQTDVLSGHNIYGFDNLKIHDRVKLFLDKGRRERTLSARDEESFARFVDTWSCKDKSYQFGRPDDVAFLYPTGLDTLLAARRFYFYLDDFTLKSLAPFLGIEIDGRQHLSAEALDVNKPETLKYHVHDIQEQLGLSMHLMLQALPLSFSTGMPFEQMLLGMNTKMWDHIGLIRSAHRKRLMPATCRAQGVARSVQALAGPAPTKKQIVERVRAMPSEERGRQRELLRVAKYGEEMPEWVEYPHLVAATDGGGEPTGYSIPGGMTLHPQKMKSHFVPWWHVVAADVGAMYPTILKALNVGADTVRIARKGEEPDAWVWLYRVSPRLLDSGDFVLRKPGETEQYADRGYMVGIKKREEPGVVNLGMSAILGMIAKVKADLGRAKAEGADPEHVKRLQLNYQSLKAARNAGTHGILVAVNVSCRQFHVLAGAHITTEGQRILHESLRELESKSIRIVYGDTDGIYISCGKNGANIPAVAELFDAKDQADPSDWMTSPEDAVAAVESLNKRFRRELDYEEFELEPEIHDSMVFVVHKNYLIFDAKNGEFVMETKGNNFKGSDKPNLARTQLAYIMEKAMRENLVWEDEDKARESMKASIKRAATQVIAELRISTLDPSELTMIQTVRPARRYKPNPDGSPSTFAKRSEALSRLLQESGMEPIRAARKLHFVVGNRPLPGLESVAKRKPGLKPIEYMWPVGLLEQDKWKTQGYRVDLDWYKEMIANYIKGAFGFDDLSTVEQRGLDAWL
jgi:DNA polymerase elongation subunit (family B)